MPSRDGRWDTPEMTSKFCITGGGLTAGSPWVPECTGDLKTVDGEHYIKIQAGCRQLAHLLGQTASVGNPCKWWLGVEWLHTCSYE